MTLHLRRSARFATLLLATMTAGLLPASATAATAASRRVLVLPLDNLGVEEDVAASLLGFLRAETKKLPGVTLIELKATGRPVGGECRAEIKCLAALAAKVRADEVVFGTVAGLGEAYSIDLKLVRVKTARESGRVTETLSGQRELLIDGVRAAAYKLLLPEQYVGRIQVELPEKGAEIWVDGRVVGTTPLKQPIAGLAPGRHALKIVKAGYADFDKWVEVRFARVSVVKVDLANSTIAGVMYENQPIELVPLVSEPTGGEAAASPAPAPAPAVLAAETEQSSVKAKWTQLTPLRKAAFGVGALAVASLVGGSAFGIVSASDRSDAEALLRENGVPGYDADEARQLSQSVETNAARANVLFVVGAAAVGGAAALWLFGAPDEVTPTVAPTAGGAVFGLSGSF